MQPTNTPDTMSETRTTNTRKWLWGLIGLASAAVVGVVISRKPPLKRETKPPVADWQLIGRIDHALSQADISGIDVYVNGGRVMLITEAGSGVDILHAKSIVAALPGVEAVDVVAKHVGETVSYSRHSEL
jgi:hypothetical protein